MAARGPLPHARRLLLLVPLLALACNGEIDGGPVSPAGTLRDVRLPARVWRLTTPQLAVEVQRLFGEGAPPIDLGVSAPEHHLSNIASAAGVDNGNVNDLLNGSSAVAAWVATEGASRTHCAASYGTAACIDTLLDWLPASAYRRPIEASERVELRALYDALVLEYDIEAGIVGIVRAVLLSPDFLYRTELGPSAPEAPSEITLTNHEIATLLAYAITDASPDDELLARAAAGTLDDPEVRETEVRRLVASSGPMWRRFFGEWLDLSTFRSQATEVGLTGTLADQMEEEYAAFLEDVIVTNDGSLEDVFSSAHSFTGPELAAHYGASHPGVGLSRIELDPAERGGLLTQGYWLVAHAKDGRDNVVRRGMNVFREGMCNEIRVPDGVDVAAALARLAPADATVREISEIRGSAGSCAGCHRIADPAGLVFENYASDASWRTFYPDGLPVEPVVELNGLGSFASAPELSLALTQSSTFRRCFLQRFTHYFVGRDVGTPSQALWLNETATTFRDEGDQLTELLVALVRHPAFIERAN